MHDQIEAIFERPLGPRTGECIVANSQNPSASRYGGDALQIDNLEHWVARRLKPYQACVGTYRGDQGVGVGKIGISCLDSCRLLPHQSKQPARAAVYIIAHDDM